MVEHLTQKQVEEYCRQQLGVAELVSVADHLEACDVCQRQVEGAMDSDAAFFGVRSQVFDEAAEISTAPLVRAHLSAEQTADYVDRNLSGEELQIISDHLSLCEPCALAVDDLLTFKNQIAPSLERQYHPATVVAAKESFWRPRLAALGGLFQRSPGLTYGAVLAILLVAVTSWWIWRRQVQSEPKQEIVVTPAPQPAPQPSMPPQPAPVVAQLLDGEGQLTLDQEGRLSGADDLPPAYQSMLKEALASRRIERSSQLKGLTRPPSSLMSKDKEGSAFSIIEPGGNVLMTDSPTFRWSAMKGASLYVVEVYDSAFNLVVASGQLTTRSWSSPALPRGKVYAWQVKATKDGQEVTSPRPPAPQARFRILDRAKANELAQARRAYPSSHLTLGLLYAEAGLLKEAEQELRALQKANPDSEIARRLLSQVQALRRPGQ